MDEMGGGNDPILTNKPQAKGAEDVSLESASLSKKPAENATLDSASFSGPESQSTQLLRQAANRKKQVTGASSRAARIRATISKGRKGRLTDHFKRSAFSMSFRPELEQQLAPNPTILDRTISFIANFIRDIRDKILAAFEKWRESKRKKGLVVKKTYDRDEEVLQLEIERKKRMKKLMEEAARQQAFDDDDDSNRDDE